MIERAVPFHFSTNPGGCAQIDPGVLLGGLHTNEKTREIHYSCGILISSPKTPMQGLCRKGRDKRYCPSIEDKVVKFADKKEKASGTLSLKVFIQMKAYVGGMSSSTLNNT